MPASQLERFQIQDPLHGAVSCVAISPPVARDSLPLCLFLYGGGGSSETLAAIQPLLDQWWTSGALPALLLATPDVGPWSFYLDDPARGLGWESFVSQRFIPSLQTRLGASAAASVGLVGTSMGGYGALKIAFAQPARFAAVAAITPMLEPTLDAAECPLRNRFHYPPEVPQALLGLDRDAELYRRDHPAARARRNAERLRESELAIYFEAAGQDAFNAQDGAEFLHRVLWDLDIAHEYHLRRDSDHVGPDYIERLLSALRWTADQLVLREQPALDATELAWQHWLDNPGSVPPQRPLAVTSPLMPRLLRAQLSAASRRAEQLDPAFRRRYGRL
jgi:S-formylglutathione hydrolase